MEADRITDSYQVKVAMALQSWPAKILWSKSASFLCLTLLDAKLWLKDKTMYSHPPFKYSTLQAPRRYQYASLL